MSPTPAVGQLWRIGGVTYRIDRIDGEDACYPIEMAEVERDPAIDREIDAKAAAYPEALKHYALAGKRLRSMNQELRWFELRKPEFLGTLP